MKKVKVNNKGLSEEKRKKLKDMQEKRLSTLEDVFSYVLELEKRIESLENQLKGGNNDGKEKSRN